MGASPQTARCPTRPSFGGNVGVQACRLHRTASLQAMLNAFRRPRLATALLALVVTPSAAAATPSILVKFKQPATAAGRIEALGDDAVGQTANRVSIVRLAPGESAAARIAAYDKRAD